MSKRGFLLLVAAAVVAISPQLVRSGGNVDSPSKINPLWTGRWELSPPLNAALGFASETSREGAVVDHPSKFQLSLDARIGATMKGRTFEVYRDQVFQRMGHKIVATGKWETTFDVDPEIETSCFITQDGGATHLWVPAPYAILYGGRLSYLPGADRQHDALVIDFNPDPKHLAGQVRSADTVGYRRRTE